LKMGASTADCMWQRAESIPELLNLEAEHDYEIQITRQESHLRTMAAQLTFIQHCVQLDDYDPNHLRSYHFTVRLRFKLRSWLNPVPALRASRTAWRRMADGVGLGMVSFEPWFRKTPSNDHEGALNFRSLKLRPSTRKNTL
jgi:hypothetical protein